MTDGNTEIERKFLVDEIPDDPDIGQGESIAQGYVAIDGEVEVRVRRRAGHHSITVKGGRGRERTEVETEVDADTFDRLMSLAGDRTVAKRRSEVATGTHTAEVDVYEGALAGLVVVEVEFESRHDADDFEPPAWFGRELTGQDGWSNADLARYGVPPEDAR